MILHPGVLALLVGAGLVLAFLLKADWIGLKVLARWDFSSSSAEQLMLERQTHLVSSLTGYALGFEIISALLFVYTADDLHQMFSGAMCATGSLNANPVGWTVLLLKLLILLLCPLWITVNTLDQRAGDFPVVRGKYFALLLLTPLVAADLGLQIAYFGKLDPEIITSCCGALFSTSKGGVAGELANLPLVPTMWLFYLSAVAFVVTAVLCLRVSATWLRLVLAALSLEFLIVGLASSIGFISLYVYQLPTHHCPFDMLQAKYHFIGYPLYLSLFTAVVFGVLPGLTRPLRRYQSLRPLLRQAERRWLLVCISSTLLVLGFATLPIFLGSMTLVGI